MRETRSSGSVEGVLSDGHSYSDSRTSVNTHLSPLGPRRPSARRQETLLQRPFFGPERLR